MGDYADWEIEDSIWGHPVWGKNNRKRRNSHTPPFPPNPPKVKFRGKTPKQYLEFIGVPEGDWDNILLEFEKKYPSNGVELTSKFQKDKTKKKMRYWSQFLSYCQQFKPT